jgi:fumarylpyruvate hydrolase
MEETPMAYVIAPPDIVSLPVKGLADRFPVHAIYCVGRNYASHALEMGDNPFRNPPFFFMKTPDSLIPDGSDFPYPEKTAEVHFEIELVAALKEGGRHILPENALDHVYGYAVGLDMTRRDLQEQAKKMGRPWEVGKSFELSAPCSEIVRASEIGHPEAGAIWLEVNGRRRQEGELSQLIWKVSEIIAYLSDFFRLSRGDLIFTGTPCCVGPTVRGDRLRGYVEHVGELNLRVA